MGNLIEQQKGQKVILACKYQKVKKAEGEELTPLS